MTTETDSANPEDTEAPATTEGVENEAAADQDQAAADGATEGEVEVNDVDFQQLDKGAGTTGKPKELNRFQEIKVSVSADLGRASVPLQTLMNLGEGSVLELDREIGSPVELVAQGVTLASGEVVVVNGCFAIRVTQVYEGQAS